MTLSGTSMATPLVAGATALVWSWMGGSFVNDLDDLETIVLESAEPGLLLIEHGLIDYETTESYYDQEKN